MLRATRRAATPKVVICGATRTPIGAIGGGLAELLPKQLAVPTVKKALEEAKVPAAQVDYCSIGWVMQDPRSPNIARTVADMVGCPTSTPGTTVHENCASGGAAIHDIARRLRLGEIKVGIAAGVESMSNVPRYAYTGRLKGQLYGDMTLVDGLMGALTDTNVGKKGELMGLLTERLVKKYNVSRELQDEIAFASHQNAVAAWKEGKFDYVMPVEWEVRGKKKSFDKDQGPNEKPLDFYKSQKAYFLPDGGTITSANASSLNDGAAAVILATEEVAKAAGYPILAELRGYGNVGVPKELMGEGAFKVVPKLLEDASMKVDDVSYWEMNEAFAAVVGGALADVSGLKRDKVNQWGSGISLGHPVGCTGARQVVDMVHQLRKRGGHIGVTTRCVGGGMGSGEVIVL